jgi:hypothetical protein
MDTSDHHHCRFNKNKPSLEEYYFYWTATWITWIVVKICIGFSVEWWDEDCFNLKVVTPSNCIFCNCDSNGKSLFAALKMWPHRCETDLMKRDHYKNNSFFLPETRWDQRFVAIPADSYKVLFCEYPA